MKKHTKGYLIAIEGIDGSGKTTLTKIIQERLVNEGKDVFALPSGGFDSKEVEAQLRKIVITENSGVTKNTETLSRRICPYRTCRNVGGIGDWNKSSAMGWYF